MKTEIRLSILERTPFAGGMEFGTTGPYERIKGRVHFAVDPGEQAYSGITDLDKAPRNEKGLVDYSTDFLILKPLELENGNRRIFFDWGNRGNIRALQFSMMRLEATILKLWKKQETGFCSAGDTALFLQAGRGICWQETGGS